MKVVGIYLAAGKSSRMGENKLALTIGTKTLGSLAITTALKSSLEKIYIIVNETDDVQWLPSNIASNNKCSIIKCSTSFDGQSESLRSGIRQAIIDQADAAIVMLADQPLITFQMIDGLITCKKETPMSKFIATSKENIIMPPILFSSTLFPVLLKMTGDKGAKSLLQGEFLHLGKLVPCTDNRLVFDVDTKEDFNTLHALIHNTEISE